ncbi:MAG TPA: outer membrane beta-barrel protein [Burkholderiales bacterium]|nr:outer membrane beta-barrel protein [Burkholderiales bacterium]
MNQLRTCLSLGYAFLLGALCGLFSAPLAHAEEEAQATPPPGKALVFVFRSEREPVAVQVPVLVNLEYVGELANGTFVTATVNPGRTHLRVGDRVLTIMSLEAAADQSYFVAVEALPGLTPARTEMRLVSETEGRRSLAQSRFVGVTPATMSAARRAEPPSEPARARQPAAARERYVPAEPGRGWDFALIASGGAFKLANADQVVAGLASAYDTTSKPVFGVEAEWRSKAGFAVGAEVFSYKNDLVAAGTSGQQEVLAIMVNGKYYFRAASWFYPFVGAGAGRAEASYSGGLTGKASGPAYQGLAGMEFRFERVGLYVQYKYLASTTGDTGQEVKVGGRGVLAGVSISF